MSEGESGQNTTKPEAAALALRDALDRQAGYPKVEQGIEYVDGVRQAGTVDVTTEHLASVRAEPAGTRYAVHISTAADAHHGQGGVNTRAGRVPSLDDVGWQRGDE